MKPRMSNGVFALAAFAVALAIGAGLGVVALRRAWVATAAFAAE